MAIKESINRAQHSTNPHNGIQHMVNSLKFEPKRSNHFELVIDGLGGLTTLEQSDANGSTPSYSSDSITLSVKSFSPPALKIGSVPVAYGNAKVQYAGVPDTMSTSVDFNDFIGLETEKILTAWFRQAYDPITEKIGYAVDYKKYAHIFEYAPDGTMVAEWKLEGVWLSGVTFGQYSQEGGNTVRNVTGQVQIDRMYPYTFEDPSLYRVGDEVKRIVSAAQKFI